MYLWDVDMECLSRLLKWTCGESPGDKDMMTEWEDNRCRSQWSLLLTLVNSINNNRLLLSILTRKEEMKGGNRKRKEDREEGKGNIQLYKQDGMHAFITFLGLLCDL